MIRSWLLKTTDSLLGPLICTFMAALLYVRGKSKSPANWSPSGTQRVLIIRPGGIGDMILMLPTISAIAKHFPDAEIDIVCEQRNMSVVSLSSIRARCLPYDRNPISLLFRLIRTSYDIAVDGEQFHHFSAVFAAVSGAQARIGFNINPRRNGLYTHLIPYSPDGFEGEQFLRLLAPLNLNTPPFSPAALHITDSAAALGSELYKRITDFRGAKKLAIVHSGASVKRKLWPADKMASLITELSRTDNMAVVVLGGKGDSSRTAAIASLLKSPHDALILINQLDLKKCAALVSMAAIFVGPDSGLLHLAVACQTPTVAIFGPSDHKKWSYNDSQHAVARKDMPCSPCFMFGYSKPCTHYACIEEITVDDVMASCRKIPLAD
jgi:ADP-heptose:LPS heptosyltransferase